MFIFDDNIQCEIGDIKLIRFSVVREMMMSCPAIKTYNDLMNIDNSYKYGIAGEISFNTLYYREEYAAQIPPIDQIAPFDIRVNNITLKGVEIINEGSHRVPTSGSPQTFFARSIIIGDK